MKMTTEKRAIDKIYKRRDRYDIPDWQRDKVWSPDQKQLLIDTILRGWQLPKFYFAKISSEPEQFEVVDGQQRLRTIYEFFDGLLTLSEKTAEMVGAETYEGLADRISDAFDDYEIWYDEITDSTEEELKEFFRRLQGGLSLTASEKLNAVHSNLTDFVRRLSKHRFFVEKVAIGDTRKAHFDIAAKVAAITVDGIDTGLRLPDLTKTFLANASFSEESNAGKLLAATFDFLDRTFPSRDPMLRNRSTIQSIATLASKLVEPNHEPGCESRFLEFCQHFGKQLAQQIEQGHKATDSDYLEYQRTISANIKAGAQIRHEILLRKLLLFDPNFARFLAAETVLTSNIQAEVSRLGESVASLIERVNDHHSSQTGDDLFKATNRTAAAIRRLHEPISEFPDYKALIDDLYFLFHEGVGPRLAGRVPQSFADINSLRTALHHDVDHGNASDVAKKRRKHGEAFRRYGGKGAPSGIAPEYFPVIQASILRALEADLKSLL